MISLSPQAERQLDELIAFYEQKDRPEATKNLLAAVQHASVRIGYNPGGGLSAPRPYPELAKAGRLWIKEGPYWIAY